MIFQHKEKKRKRSRFSHSQRKKWPRWYTSPMSGRKCSFAADLLDPLELTRSLSDYIISRLISETPKIIHMENYKLGKEGRYHFQIETHWQQAPAGHHGFSLRAEGAPRVLCPSEHPSWFLKGWLLSPACGLYSTKSNSTVVASWYQVWSSSGIPQAGSHFSPAQNW